MHVLEAIRERGSTRAFLPVPVRNALLREVLSAARYAPSGTNMQPWRVHVVSGAVRDALCASAMASARAGHEDPTPYAYYPPTWREPYLSRRRACGWGLYGTLGIVKTDRERMLGQQVKNFDFFGAPTGMFFTVDRDLSQGSWLDYGMFLQTVMLAARGVGLATCPQAAWLSHHELVRRTLSLPDTEALVCGMAIGYQDLSDAVNGFRPERIGVDQFVRWHADHGLAP